MDCRADRDLDRIAPICIGMDYNTNSIGICYIGGCAADGKTPKDTRTPEQRSSMRLLVDNLLAQFPGASVHCHNEFARKACPSFKLCDL